MKVEPFIMNPIPPPWGIERTEYANWIGPMRKDESGKVAEIVCSIDRHQLTPAALGRNDANADLIVRAVNSHEALIEFAQEVLFWMGFDKPHSEPTCGCRECSIWLTAKRLLAK